MAKRRRIPPTPKLPDKVEYYYRACNETTSDGLENILAESRKTAKRAYNKPHLGTLDLWEWTFSSWFVCVHTQHRPLYAFEGGMSRFFFQMVKQTICMIAARIETKLSFRCPHWYGFLW